MAVKELTLEKFIEETGSAAPTPGGGSVAALTASSAAALIEMVTNLTIGNEKYQHVDHEMQVIQTKTAAMKRQFLDMIDEDCEAFNEIMAAYKLPKNTDEEKALRMAHIQAASQKAALVPFKIG